MMRWIEWRGRLAPDLGDKVGLDIKVGVHRLALSMKDLERVRFTGHEEAEIVHVERLGHRRVHATDVEHERGVDEHPHVVIAKEAERLAAIVGERKGHLRGKEEVVPLAIAAVCHVILAEAIEREVLGAGELVRQLSSCSVRERERAFDSHVPRGVRVPFVRERVAVADHTLRVRAHGRAAGGSELVLHHSGGGAHVIDASVEVGMVLCKVAVRHLHYHVSRLTARGCWRWRR